jgi:hypothetical protein
MKRLPNSGSFTSERLTRHGMHNTPEWRAWKDMKARCSNPRLGNYSRYGGRGITVCDRWQIFENFIADVGRRPSADHSLERKDNDGNYEPGNVRWATRLEQARNTRRNRMIEIDGKSLTISEWARERGVSRFRIRDRLDAGIAAREAVFG